MFSCESDLGSDVRSAFEKRQNEISLQLDLGAFGQFAGGSLLTLQVKKKQKKWIAFFGLK